MGIVKAPSKLSPDTVLPQRHSLKRGKRTMRIISNGNEVIAVNGAFTEISFFHYKNSSLLVELPSEKDIVYDSSRAVPGKSNVASNEGRTKIEISSRGGSHCLISSVEYLCNADEGKSEERNNHTEVQNCAESSGDFIEFCPSFGDGRNYILDPCEPTIVPVSYGHGACELLPRMDCPLNRNVSSAPSTSESSSSFRVSTKSRFNPIRKVFEPFAKSKHQRSHFEFTAKPRTGLSNIGRKKVPDFVQTIGTPDIESYSEKVDSCRSSISSSPVHLHGNLKVKYHLGVPYFKFSLNNREQVFVAKLWKLGSGFSWTYTFHSISDIKRKNLSDWGLSHADNEASLIGQMQVSCNMGSSSDKERSPNSSMVTEFVLYDISHARLNICVVPSPDRFISSSSDSCVVNSPHKDDIGTFHIRSGTKRALCQKTNLPTSFYPIQSEALHTGLEIAAIVIELPYEERESLKYRRGDIKSGTIESDMLTWPLGEQRTKKYGFQQPLGTVKVVIPDGHHSVGTGDSQGPSPLLDRWRFGGQCDCGGWDMACSLSVLCNIERPLGDDNQPMELHQMGSKKETPSMTFSAVGSGEYQVDFHAQLSTLQAFSICVAMLHTTEASCSTKEAVNHKLEGTHSVAVFIEDETIEQTKGNERTQPFPPLYIGTFPFSPISRV